MKVLEKTTTETMPRREAFPADLGDRLLAAFDVAASRAVAEAHAAGLAVYGERDGVAIEVRPDGTVARIDTSKPWSPTAWRDGHAG